jgi:hypothetical protein
MASVTLSYSGKTYCFTGDDETVLKGKLACDCGKSHLIRSACDPDFPVLKCGASISIVSVVEASQISRKSGA